ncbi:MAG: HEAT repeat domain-containing protein, partial [Burkholderiales bacterium]|nr:HEAT repeat domain-containing protein [Anaerolineae bacterium]
MVTNVEDTNALRALIDLLNDEDADVQQTASVQLAESGKAAVPLLIDALSDSRWRVRYLAAWALG